MRAGPSRRAPSIPAGKLVAADPQSRPPAVSPPSGTLSGKPGGLGKDEARYPGAFDERGRDLWNASGGASFTMPARASCPAAPPPCPAARRRGPACSQCGGQPRDAHEVFCPRPRRLLYPAPALCSLHHIFLYARNPGCRLLETFRLQQGGICAFLPSSVSVTPACTHAEPPASLPSGRMHGPGTSSAQPYFKIKNTPVFHFNLSLLHRIKAVLQ